MTFIVHSGIKWSDSLQNATSKLYKNLSTEFKREMNSTFHDRINAYIDEFTQFEFRKSGGDVKSKVSTGSKWKRSISISMSDNAENSRDPGVEVDAQFTVKTRNSSKVIQSVRKLENDTLKLANYTIKITNIRAELEGKSPDKGPGSSEEKKKSKFPKWQIALIVLCSIVVVAALVYVAVKCKMKSRGASKHFRMSEFELLPPKAGCSI
ncbi:Uncharacterised protein g6744 [Pycnogonum litorale]